MRNILLVSIAFALAVVALSASVQQEQGEGHDHDGEGKHHHHHHHHKHHHHHHKHHHHKHHGHHGHHHHWKCMGEPVNSNDELVKAKNECVSEFKVAKENDEESRQKGRTCKSLCAGKKIGFFDEDGQVVASKVNELVETIIESTEAQAEIKEKAIECHSNHTHLFKNGASDETCTNYKPYLKCLWMSTVQTCMKNFEPEDWE